MHNRSPGNDVSPRRLPALTVGWPDPTPRRGTNIVEPESIQKGVVPHGVPPDRSKDRNLPDSAPHAAPMSPP
ncbi:hypothetical protein GCM10010394_61170 [Streptomyces crystallinus]|uniref:Uncharacterized protein n=1 Tax=Streptomyces crystallinus TaxID=68191 RepID=A0ABP3RZY2_9ACTN